LLCYRQTHIQWRREEEVKEEEEEDEEGHIIT